MSNRDIALNWQGLPLPVSSRLVVCLTDLLNRHHPTWPQARAVTMNFRAPVMARKPAAFIRWKSVCNAEEIYGPWSI